MPTITADYFKEYRNALGHTTISSAKKFLGAKDVNPGVNTEYLNSLIDRLGCIAKSVNLAIHTDYRQPDIEKFVADYIDSPKETIVNNGLIGRLTNQGRRPEQVLFSWLRGYAFCEFFKPAFSAIFETDIDSITQIGEDDFNSHETFKRMATADLELNIRGERPVILEVQCGFQGINDIKAHKIYEAKRVYQLTGKPTICVHADIFNGQVAFVRLDDIEDDDNNFVARQQMEGQLVLNIDQNHFTWKLLEKAPPLDPNLFGRE